MKYSFQIRRGIIEAKKVARHISRTGLTLRLCAELAVGAALFGGLPYIVRSAANGENNYITGGHYVARADERTLAQIARAGN